MSCFMNSYITRSRDSSSRKKILLLFTHLLVVPNRILSFQKELFGRVSKLLFPHKDCRWLSKLRICSKSHHVFIIS